jgi:opacity protein-like surface antigen
MSKISFKGVVPLLALAGVLLVGAGSAAAQHAHLTFDSRLGLGVPISSFADEAEGWEGAASEGVTFGLSFGYEFWTRVILYAGFSQHRFGCPTQGCGLESDLVGTGFDIGSRILLRSSGTVVPWTRFGWTTYRVEGDFQEGDERRSDVSERTSGWEAGGGVAIVVTRKIALNPGVRYSTMTPEFSPQGDLRMRYLVVDLGLLVGF